MSLRPLTTMCALRSFRTFFLSGANPGAPRKAGSWLDSRKALVAIKESVVRKRKATAEQGILVAFWRLQGTTAAAMA